MDALSLRQDDLEGPGLLKYLQNTGNFRYFADSTVDYVSKLQAEFFGEAEKPAQRESLLELWQRVLTDALLGLKWIDPREVDRSDDKTDYRSFFNEESLGVLELRGVVDAFMRFETHMYAASPEGYRDHVRHSFLVWLTGHRLLREALGGRLFMDAPENLVIGADEWECMWALAALCHDIGYPLTKADAVSEHAKGILKKQGFRSTGDLSFSFSAEVQPFNEAVMKLIASKVVPAKPPLLARLHNLFLPRAVNARADYLVRYHTHIQNKYYLKFLKSFDQLGHGAVSALLMAKSLVYFLESDLCLDDKSPLGPEDARQFLIRREMLRAVAAHTCPDIYHLEFNSLSFLLFIADEIQESGRPTLEETLGSPPRTVKLVCTAVEFGKEKLRIQMATSARLDDDKAKEAVCRRLGKLRRKLRLAVGTLKMKALDLRLSIKTGDDKEVALVLGRAEDGMFGIRIVPDECESPR